MIIITSHDPNVVRGSWAWWAKGRFYCTPNEKYFYKLAVLNYGGPWMEYYKAHRRRYYYA